MQSHEARIRAVLVLMIALSALAPIGCVKAPVSSAAALKVATERCSGCHSASKALDWKAPTSKLANDLIDRMVGQGATLTPAERAILVAHFLL